VSPGDEELETPDVPPLIFPICECQGEYSDKLASYSKQKVLNLPKKVKSFSIQHEEPRNAIIADRELAFSDQY